MSFHEEGNSGETIVIFQTNDLDQILPEFLYLFQEIMYISRSDKSYSSASTFSYPLIHP